MARLWMWMATAALLLAAPSLAASPSDSVNSANQQPGRQGTRHSGRTAFAVLEMGCFARVAGQPQTKGGEYPGARIDEKSDWLLVWESGALRNVGGGSAVGATAFLGVDDFESRWGLRARYRRWLSPRRSLDLAAGPLLGSLSGDSDAAFPGMIASVQFGQDDLVFAGLHYQVLPKKYRPTERLVYLGATFGSGKSIWIPVGLSAVLGFVILTINKPHWGLPE